jgi:hypothetical protein
MKVMMTLSAPKPPTLEEIRQKFQLDVEDLDEAFGVIEVDPNDQTYAFLVEESKVALIRPQNESTLQGPFSNPSIQPFGPPE